MAHPRGPRLAAAPHGTSQRWWVLAVATAQQAGLTFVRFGLPTLVPFVRADLGLSLIQAGLVLGAFDLGALFLYYPTGVATDRFGERSVMAAGALATAALAGAAAAAPGFWELALLLALAGIGFPSSQVAGSHAIMAWFPRQQRGLAMGVRQAGLPIGGLAAALGLPAAATAWGWRAALGLAAAGCGLAGVATYLAMADPDRPRTGPAPTADSTAAGGGLPQALRVFRDQRGVTLGTLVGCLLGACQLSLTGYLPLYMVDAFGWDRAAGARLLWVVHTGGIAGRMMWGWASDRLFGGRRTPPLVAAASSAAVLMGALAALPALAALWPGSVAGVALAVGFVLLGWNALYITLVAELAGEASAPVLGLSMTALYLFTMLGPPAFGGLVEAVGRYGPAWLVLAALAVGAAALSWAAGGAPRGAVAGGDSAAPFVCGRPRMLECLVPARRKGRAGP